MTWTDFFDILQSHWWTTYGQQHRKSTQCIESKCGIWAHAVSVLAQANNDANWWGNDYTKSQPLHCTIKTKNIQCFEGSGGFAILKPEKVSAQNIWKNEVWRIWVPILNTATYLSPDPSNTYTKTGKQTSIPNWTDRNLNPYAWCGVCTITLQKPNVIFTSQKEFWWPSAMCTHSLFIQSVTGGTDQTSGECSLGQTIPI